MTKSFLVFPTGATGAGLLLLRLALATMLITCLPQFQFDTMKAAFVCVALALCAGLGSRIASVVAGLIVAGAAFKLGGQTGLFVGLHAATAVALCLLGPGGYSIDARRFGRRIIDLD